jgi:integrase
VLAYAEDEGALENNPAAKVQNAKVQRDEPDPFDMEEVEAIVQDLRAHNAEDVDYFEYAGGAGVRPSEKIALVWRDFDRKRELLRMQRARVSHVRCESHVGRAPARTQANEDALRGLFALDRR